MYKLRSWRQLYSEILELCSLVRKIKTDMPYYAVANGRKPGIYNTWMASETLRRVCLAMCALLALLVAWELERLQEAFEEDTEEESEEEIDEDDEESDEAVEEKDEETEKKLDNNSTRAECEAQTKGFPKARYKKFSTEGEANDFIASNSSGKAGPVSSNLRSESKAKRFEPYARPTPTARHSSTSSKAASSLGTLPYSPTGFMASCSRSETHVDEKGYVHVYTDGACSSNGRTGAQAGIGVFFGPNHPMNVSRPVEGRPTNNVAEIEAAKAAVSQARNMGHNKVVVNTDSEFMIKAVNQWMPRWQQNGWQTAAGGEVKNRTEFQGLAREMSGVDVQFRHVRGHRGDYGNEAADALARQGAASYNRRK